MAIYFTLTITKNVTLLLLKGVNNMHYFYIIIAIMLVFMHSFPFKTFYKNPMAVTFNTIDRPHNL